MTERSADDRAHALFAEERTQLLGVAYRLLGTMTDAEDVLQDVFERWLKADRSDIENPAAYLTTMTTRAAIDRLRSAQAKREVYVGPWLPEPVTTADTLEDPASMAELDESLTIGYLHLLEQLTPLERGAYLLHDVFDFSFREVATMVDRQEAACRQLASRARAKLKASRPDEYRAPVPEVEVEVCNRLVGAVVGGDIDEVMSLMTEDVVHLSDGGANHRAARRPIIGRDRVARLLVNLARRVTEAGQGTAPDAPRAELRMLRVNHQPAVLVMLGRRPITLLVIEVSGDLVRRLYAVVNPDKLQSVLART